MTQHPQQSFEELALLARDVVDGQLTPAQGRRLGELLHGQLAAQRFYFDYIDLHVSLEFTLGNTINELPLRPTSNIQSTSGRHKSSWQSARQATAAVRQSPFQHSAWRMAAVLVFVATAVMTLTSPLWWGWKKAAPLATLADAVEAQWDMPQPLDVGDALPSGPLDLKAGYVHIVLSNGVNLVLKGPAHFSVESLLRVQLDVGKLTADVPHTAMGFTVKTPTASVTDLGTTFGVTAFANGAGEVQVLKGKVQAKLLAEDNSVKAETVLTQDQAAAYNPNTGTMASIPATPDSYVTDIHHIAPVTPYAHWLAYSNELRKDPSLLAYYAFDNQAEAPQRLLNRAAASSGKFDGQIENATWDEGRFPGKQALYFNGNDSRVKINIPQQSNQLTLAIWVRIDSLAHDVTGFLTSDGWNTQGEVAWQIAYESHAVSVGGGFTLATAAPADAVGQWILLAATLDVQSSTITLYRNGVVQVSQKVSDAVPMTIGAARIGSWNALSSTDRVRNRTLNGRIDELAIFDRVLSTQEIQDMYQAGHNEK